MNLLISDNFDYPDGLITNEYATHHVGQPGIYESDIWQATSGSLFARSGRGYSGRPDGGLNGVNIDSLPENGSAVLRVITKRADLSNVSVRFKLTNIRFVTTERTPEKAWNGFHVFIRRQDEDNTYYVDVGRRDGTLQIKRKLRRAYQAIAATVSRPIIFNSPIEVRVDVMNMPNKLVDLRLFLDDALVLQTADGSRDRIVAAGSVGIRADNLECYIDDFQVMSMGDV